MSTLKVNLMQKSTFAFLGFLLCLPIVGNTQISKSDSIAFVNVLNDFKASIIKKDSVLFHSLFFNESVDFTGIMSKKTEASIKKNYPEFQGISVSNYKSFISDICKSPKKLEEEFYNLVLASDGAIGSISFDYAFYSEGKMIQWGNEKWNLARDGEKWLITDVLFSIHFPGVEPFPFN